jgi:hypothetical protein
MTHIPCARLVKAGAQWYHTDDHHTTSLSKASLGRFMYEVLKVGAQIGTVWPFALYPRSSVYFTVFMTPEMKSTLESLMPDIKFKDPPKAHVNGS